MQDYALSNSVEMILKKEDILIGKNNLDITKEIMNEIRSIHKEIPNPAP